MNTERYIPLEVFKKGGILTAAIGVLVVHAPAVALGVISYFIGDYIQPKQHAYQT